jgi:hypothetical protein
MRGVKQPVAAAGGFHNFDFCFLNFALISHRIRRPRFPRTIPPAPAVPAARKIKTLYRKK